MEASVRASANLAESLVRIGLRDAELLLPGMASVLRSAELLHAPEMVLDILRTYTLFSRRSSTQGGYVMKVIPRYPQVEAVDSIVERVRDTTKRQGLVWHHQGSGKTLLMAFADACASHPRPRSNGPSAGRRRVVISVMGTNDLHGRIEMLPLLAGYVDNLRRARERAADDQTG